MRMVDGSCFSFWAVTFCVVLGTEQVEKLVVSDAVLGFSTVVVDLATTN